MTLPSTPSASSQPPNTPQLHVVTAPSSSMFDRPLARPGCGPAAPEGVIRAHHFLVDVVDKDLHHYHVTITPAVASKKECWHIISELVTSLRESQLGKCSPVYDGRKSLHTAGLLPFSSKDFVVKLFDKLDSKERKEREYDVAIKFAGKADLHHLQQFLGDMQLDDPQETLQVLDVILRSEPSTKSFFYPGLGEMGILGDGLKYWKGFYQSLRPPQMGLSLNIDVSARAFYEPVLVSKFVESYSNIRDLRRPLSDQDRMLVKKALPNIRVELVFRDGSQCKISGASAQPQSPLMFSRNDLGTRTSVRYCRERYQINFSFPSFPELQAGYDAMPICLPTELCKIVQGQSYSKKLNEKQVTALLRTTCQRPHDGEQGINKIMRCSTSGLVMSKRLGALKKEQERKVSPLSTLASSFGALNEKDFHGIKEVVLATTSAWDILGFTLEKQEENVKEHTNTVIGVIDTGIFPEAQSFSAEGIEDWDRPLIGSKDPSFSCNNKIVGAKMFYKPNEDHRGFSDKSIRDRIGHGTGMACIAAGNFVNASFGRLKVGTGRGGVPAARIAVYKFCPDQSSAKMHRAIREAIMDEVNVINMSFGMEFDEEMVANKPHNYLDDNYGVATLSSITKGILACCAAGNGLKYVTNFAPWMLTVGSCNSPASFITNVYLGKHGKSLQGYSLNRFEDTQTCKLIFLANAILEGGSLELDTTKVTGKIIVSLMNGKGDRGPKTALALASAAVDAGATGLILYMEGDGLPPCVAFPLPCAWFDNQNGVVLRKYLQKSSKRVVKICTSVEISNDDFPALSLFSARGPNPLAEFTKPDICAIGENLLVEGLEKDSYRLTKGTSAATALVSGVVAYVRSRHPDWTPSAIKSAIMTTAKRMKVRSDADLERIGSGLVNPLKAVDPGLVYDLTAMDYINFLDGKGEDISNCRKYIGPTLKPERSIQPHDFNYPSFRASLQDPDREIVFRRRVKHVGVMNSSTYNAQFFEKEGKTGLLEAVIHPIRLSFDRVDQELSFRIRIRVREWSESGLIAASLVWRNDIYTVHSPIILVRRV